MLQDPIKAQLRTHFDTLSHPIELAASLDDGAKSQELRTLLSDLSDLSDKISFADHAEDARRPSFTVARNGAAETIRFAGIPMGHEFTSLVLALLQVGGHKPKLSDDLTAQIAALEGEFEFETYISLSCQNCPDVVQALNAMSVINPRIRHTMIDGALFQDEVEARGILSVPQVFLNGQPFGSGRMDAEGILAKLDTGASARAAVKLGEKAPFDVLVLGAGPAGASAAMYAARKGVRTGIVAERFGGQVLDTMAIENFTSVPETEGPKFAAALEAHVRHYDVDITTGQQAVSLKPSAERGGFHEITTAFGATLRTKSLILAPGARWRHMNVPGETEYRNKGVAYCPHCDGPLFKGKRVAVIGGGNSGVEAAIDLAGIVSHVTLIEFGDALRADQVLQTKLRSLPNVKIITRALTQEVLGDGQRVIGLTYRDRGDESQHRIDLEGIFVQIGLVPNTEWLRDTLELTERGEIVVDTHGATSAPGIFAAGDATTTPYKQIIIATGDGAKAALSAFDYLIRLPVVEKAAA